MIAARNRTTGKYFRIELLFLLFMSYFRAVISDLEYSYYEEGNIWNFVNDLEYRLVYGTSSIILYGFYYWGFLKPLLAKNKIFYLILSAIGFIVVDSICNKYQNLLVSELDFLSDDIRTRALLDYEKIKIRFVLNYVLSYTLFTLLGVAYLVRSLQQDEAVKALKEQQLLTELNYLKAQLQPHFFFNTLNNIYALAIRQSKDTAPMVAKLSQMMRYVIYESGSPQVPLEREIEFLNNYVEIEQIRRPSNIVINFDMQGHTTLNRIEPLLLLPLVENAFKHGIEDEIENGFVRVVLDVTERELTLQVENSKPSILAASSGGVGLKNMTKRLNLLYPGRHELDIEETENTYRAILTLQLV